ncbi:MAG: zinc-ribbon domain-containing protein [Planctomycetes bacterium]|nr:zinc-ribbon domain-containing protein [Planctomycetota bacterium]
MKHMATTAKKNFLAAQPSLAKEWHPTKNKYLTSRDVTHGTSRKVWWMCSKGHEWQAKVVNRTHGNNCPICARNRRKTKR